jgi:hypothetical protein
MPTTVHIPKPLLAAVDRKAKALRVSRNKLIVRALEREVADRDWTPGLLDGPPLDEETTKLLEDSLRVVRERRKSKGRPPAL